MALEAGKPRSRWWQPWFLCSHLSCSSFFFHWVLTWSPLWMYLSGVSQCMKISSSYKDTSKIGWGPIHITSFYPEKWKWNERGSRSVESNSRTLERVALPFSRGSSLSIFISKLELQRTISSYSIVYISICVIHITCKNTYMQLYISQRFIEQLLYSLCC